MFESELFLPDIPKANPKNIWFRFGCICLLSWS